MSFHIWGSILFVKQAYGAKLKFYTEEIICFVFFMCEQV